MISEVWAWALGIDHAGFLNPWERDREWLWQWQWEPGDGNE